MGEGVYENGAYRVDDVRIMDRTGDHRLPIGDDGFERVAARSLFVDKSLLVADILDSDCAVTLFCRPRRFGKTLAMTMLRAFLSCPATGSRAPRSLRGWAYGTPQGVGIGRSRACGRWCTSR